MTNLLDLGATVTDYHEPTWADPSDDENTADVEAFEADSEIETETEPEGQGK